MRRRNQKMRGVRNITLAEALEELDDPRTERVVRYPLAEILFTVICGVLCGAQSYVEMARTGEDRLEWYRQYLPFANGIPSAWAMAGVMRRVDPEKVHTLFVKWMQGALTEAGIELKDEIVPIDGKQARRTKDGDTKPLHVVTALAADCRLVLGQIACEAKSNEITAIPALLDMLDINGAFITIDAMGTQHAVAGKIREKGADYLLCVKKNRKVQYRELEAYFAPCLENGYRPGNGTYACTTDGEHGRIERRECWITDDVSALPQTAKWNDIAGAAMIRSTVTKKGKTTVDVRYFIFSRKTADAAVILHANRTHWRIENSLHWVLDIAFAEDTSRARRDHSAENLNIVRHIAFNILREVPELSGGYVSRQRRCLLNHTMFNAAVETLGFMTTA